MKNWEITFQRDERFHIHEPYTVIVGEFEIADFFEHEPVSCCGGRGLDAIISITRTDREKPAARS